MEGWQKFRKKESAVDAWGPWDGTEQGLPAFAWAADSAEYMRWRGDPRIVVVFGYDELSDQYSLALKSTGGTWDVPIGWYIVRYNDGGMGVRSPEDFEDMYEPER